MSNICELNSANLPKGKKKAFKDFLNNNLTDNSLLNINNLNLINSLKGKDKVIKDFSINKPSGTLLTKRKPLIIKIPFIKRNP